MLSLLADARLPAVPPLLQVGPPMVQMELLQEATAKRPRILLRPFEQLALKVRGLPGRQLIWLLATVATVGLLRRVVAGRSRVRRLVQLAAAALAAAVGSRARSGQRLASAAVAAIRGRGDKDESDEAKGERICVVGGGIAGCSAAWVLDKKGFEVTLLEQKPVLGGNMKTNVWNVDGQKVRTGLGVLAWPKQLFHNYGAVIEALGVKTSPHILRWFLTRRLAGRELNDVECVYAHEPSTPAAQKAMKEAWLLQDLQRWNRLMDMIKRVNHFFCPPPIPGVHSIYRSSLLNPLNVISLRFLARIYGISQRFWDEVFVAIHASSFLETKFDDLPAVIAEVIEDIVPLGNPDAPPEMESWLAGHGDEVFQGLTANFKERVLTSTGCEAVRVETNASGKSVVLLTDTDGIEHTFDRVVFACGAPATLRSLPAACPVDSFSERARYWALQSVLAATKYVEDRDLTYERGVVHSDSKMGLPTEFEQEIVNDFGTYCESKYKANGEIDYENVFVVSAWVPEMQKPENKGKRSMLISWNCKERLKNIGDEHYEKDVVMREAHPQLSVTNMFASYFVWRHLQGSCNNTLYFTGSFITPGNGHDLSMLSGFVVAKHLGADYPFPENEPAFKDFQLLQNMMGLAD